MLPNFWKSQPRLIYRKFLKGLRKSSVIQRDSTNDPRNSLHDEKYLAMFPELKKMSKSVQKVLAIQPNIKKGLSESSDAHLESLELCALIESIPLWRVVDETVEPLKKMDHHRIFGTGKLDELTNRIKELKRGEGLTGVVVGIHSLKSNQLMNLEKLWGLPVYDRFSVILEIFRTRAQTNEAKMQVALAEISYLRSILYSLHNNSMEHHRECLEVLGGSGETFVSTRKHLLREREARIRKEVDKIESQKKLFRSHRKKADLPVIAVVGYTNAGKTSLIKCLTGDSKISPENKLFATLDVNVFTVHQPNKQKVLYMDTIGFISNIPSSLFRAFHASLQDIAFADLVMVVSDCSHPDKVNQDRVVMQTLKDICKRSSSTDPSTHPLLQNLIFVHNKSDLLSQKERTKLEASLSSPKEVMISLKEGLGMRELEEMVQKVLGEVTGMVRKKLKVPINGNMLAWLFKETIVESLQVDPDDSEKYLMEVKMTSLVKTKFFAKFKPKKS